MATSGRVKHGNPLHSLNNYNYIDMNHMKTYKYIALAVLALGLAACSQEDDFTPQGNQKDAPLAIASAGVAKLSTRAAITSQGGIDYLTGGSIGVFVTTSTGGRYAGSNVKWTYSDSQWGLDDATVVLYEANATNQRIGVCYPYMDAVNGKYKIELPAAFDSNYDDYDYLYADYTALSSNPATIQMNHLLSKVTVNVALGTEMGDVTVSEVFLCDVPRTASWKVPSNTFSSFGMADQVTKLYANDINNDGIADNYVGYALPNAATELGVRVVMENDKNFLFGAQVRINSGLASGNHYRISLKVGKDIVTVSSVSVEPWGTGGNINNDNIEATELSTE